MWNLRSKTVATYRAFVRRVATRNVVLGGVPLLACGLLAANLLLSGAEISPAVHSAGKPDAADKRTASTILTGLSASLITGTFSVMALMSALLIFLTDKRKVAKYFFCWVGSAYFLLFAGIYFGAQGITEIAKNGEQGNWLVRTPSGFFNMQAGCAIVGAVLFFASSPESMGEFSFGQLA